jgi:hypothetical protein
MSTLLATESMGYVEKVSGMWKGGKKHYDEPHGLRQKMTFTMKAMMIKPRVLKTASEITLPFQ